MPRNSPCQSKKKLCSGLWCECLFCKVCKHHRRKCEWQPQSPVCIRCKRLNLDCRLWDNARTTFCDNDSNSLDDTDYDRLHDWWNRLMKLEEDFEKLESFKKHIQLVLKPKDVIPTDRQEDTTAFDTLESDMQSVPEWKLCVVDGKIHLKSSIKTVDELLAYGRAFNKYLAPYSGIFTARRLLFASARPYYRRPAAAQLPSRPVFDLNLINFQRNLDNTVTFISQLVNTYVVDLNTVFPIIHVPTFLRYFHKLKDPLKSPIALAMCVHVCVNPCINSGRVSESDRRRTADFFYHRCKDLLLDIFDESSRRLETLIAINLLQKYLSFGILQLEDAKRLLTMAQLVCEDLKRTYCCTDEVPLVQRALFERNAIHAMGMIHILDSALGREYREQFSWRSWKVAVLPGECKETAEYAEMCSHFVRLIWNPVVADIMVSLFC